MIDEGAVLQALSKTEIAELCKIFGVDKSVRLARLIGTEHELGDLGAPYQTWIERMERFVQTVRPESYRLEFQPPANEKEIRDEEERLGIRLPESGRICAISGPRHPTRVKRSMKSRKSRPIRAPWDGLESSWSM
ncbi:MAG: hypothetical protein AAGE52_31120 [Myxococcota bacterium]